MPTTTGKATDFITFSRASNATVVDSDGKIKWAGHNLLTNSESFDGSAWVKTNVTVAANAAVAPNGTTTADTVTLGAGTASKYIYQTRASLGAQTTMACYVKIASGTVRYIQLLQNNDVQTYANFDITGNATGSKGTNTPTSAITSIGSDWYYITATFAGSGDSPFIQIVDGASSGYSPSTSATGTFHLWGAHLYRSDLGGMQANPAMGAGMGSYYPTTPRNLLGATEDFSNGSVWGYVGLSAFGSGSVANAAIAPNGLQTADLLMAAATTNSHFTQQQKTTVANAEVTYSIYAKYSTAQYIAFGFVSGSLGTAWGFATVDIQAGTITQTTVGAGGSTIATATITPVGNGWHRISVKGKYNQTDTYVTVNIVNSATPTFGNYGAYSWTAAGTETVYVWGVQLSDSASLDTYTPVYGAAVTSAAYYGPRRDFDPVTLACKGLLVEEQRTNAVLYSEDLTQSAWTKTGLLAFGSGSTHNTSATTSPSGLNTADHIVEDTSNGVHGVSYVNSADGGANRASTFSIYVKVPATNGRTKVRILSTDNATGGVEVIFDLSAVSYTAPNVSGNYSSGAAAIVGVGNGWYRCSVTATKNGSGNSTIVPLVYLYTTTNSYTGDGVSGLYVWGAQIDVVSAGSATFSSSYIPTGASTATRTADVASVSTQAFPYSASEGTLVVQSTIRTWSSTAYPTHVSLNDGTGNNLIVLYHTNAGATAAEIYTSGAQEFTRALGTVSDNATVKMAIAYKSDSTQAARDGTASTVDTSSSIPSVTKLDIAQYANSQRLNGWVRQITYIPRRLTAAELQSRTA